jgi:outer membrane protein
VRFLIINNLFKIKMKKLPLILSIVALAAVAGLYVITFVVQKPKTSANSLAADEGTVAVSGDIVFVNLDSLIRSYDMYFDLQKEFETKAKSKEGDFAARRNKLEREVRDFQEKYEKGLVTRSQAMELQEGLQVKQQDMVQLGQKMQSELAEEEAVMLRQIQDNIRKYILEYNAEKGYRLILSNANNNVLLYGEQSLNITGEILKGLNESYVKVRKK